ncbi:MAG: HAD family phosphatase [Oscillospiraceae bacterium]|nr:HAD family phosphatase [Oscillospiraceae bacterium]
MTKNILFDMGNVLVRFDPALFLRRLGREGEDAELLDREVFRSVEWVRLDRGDLDDGEALAGILPRLPARLHPAAEELVTRWDRPYTPIEGMPELVRDLSEAGLGLYLLTNAARRHRDYWPRFPLAQYFDRRIMLSADWLLLKPEPAFYEKALSLFGLDRRECLFIDDNPINVESALRLGLPALVFHGDAERLRRELRERGVPV